MISKVIFFDHVRELMELTSLPESKLWELGFDLDDMEWGFVSEEPWDKNTWWTKPGSDGYFMYHILDWMDSHCVGYREVFYGGKWYYMLYHS